MKSRLGIKPGWKYIGLLLIFHLIVSECHEQAHIQTGYLLCGCYGARDFINWTSCATCTSPYGYLISAAGPLFSYSLYFLGTWLIIKEPAKPTQIAAGFLLLFGPVPFARFFTALMGGGDESVFLSYFLSNRSLVYVLAIIITFLTCMIPILLVFRVLKNRGLIWILCFCLLPMLAGMVYQRFVGNGLLKRGWLAQTQIAGTPDLILLNLAFLLALFILFRKWITDLNVTRT